MLEENVVCIHKLCERKLLVILEKIYLFMLLNLYITVHFNTKQFKKFDLHVHLIRQRSILGFFESAQS